MSEATNKKRPDYIAHAVIPSSDNSPTRFIRAGVGFTLKSGGVSILTDGIALSGHLILVGIDDELPSLSGFSHGHPSRAADFVASLPREAGPWPELGSAFRQEGYISVHVAVWPHAGKIILGVPKARQ